VVVRPKAVKTDAEMAAELTRIAEDLGGGLGGASEARARRG
jgi:hypothetical protein